MVILRANAIAREADSSGKHKIAAAPDNGRANEPWQWSLTVTGLHPARPSINGQLLALVDPETGGQRTLELAIEKSLVRATMSSESFESQIELARDEGELVVVYMNSGCLAFGNHRLGTGDAAVISGSEHFKVAATPLSDEVDAALVRLKPVSDSGLVWVP